MGQSRRSRSAQLPNLLILALNTQVLQFLRNSRPHHREPLCTTVLNLHTTTRKNLVHLFMTLRLSTKHQISDLDSVPMAKRLLQTLTRPSSNPQDKITLHLSTPTMLLLSSPFNNRHTLARKMPRLLLPISPLLFLEQPSSPPSTWHSTLVLQLRLPPLSTKLTNLRHLLLTRPLITDKRPFASLYCILPTRCLLFP